MFGGRATLRRHEGRYPVPPGASELLGVEFSGTVAELGTQVTQWKVDDEVFGLAGGVRFSSSAACSAEVSSRVHTRNTS